MSELPRRESPLNQIQLIDRPDGSEAAVLLAELPFQGLVNLRGRPDDEPFQRGSARVIGRPLPLEPNTVADVGSRRLFWLGPDEWMVSTPPDEQDALIAGLRAALDDCFCSLVDVTGYYTTIAVGGERAADLLSKGCTLDLHPRAFAPGQCAQTHVAKATTLIWPVDEAPVSYRVLVRRSFADYLGRWFNAAVREFGGAGHYDQRESTGADAERVVG